MAETKPKSIFEPDAAEDARLDAEAMAAYRAGRYVPHARVAEWLELLGDSKRAALPEAGAALNEVVWTEPALAHLEAIRAYIRQFNPSAARQVAASLKALGDSLNNFPHRGRPVRGTSMRELISTYPYVIRYTIDGDTVVILRVRHTSRRPTKP